MVIMIFADASSLIIAVQWHADAADGYDFR